MPSYAYVLLILLVICAPTPGPAQDTGAERDAAVTLLNHLRYAEAASKLRALLKINPKDYYAYSLLWNALGHLEGPTELKQQVAADVQSLAGTPKASRTESFYGTYRDGLERLGKTREVSQIDQEEIGAFPAGRTAQFALLDIARQEHEPKAQALLYEKFVHTFPASQLVAEAQRKRFDLISTDRKDFPVDLLLASAADWSNSEKSFAARSGDGYNYIACLYHIAEALVALSPRTALKYETDALTYIAATWPETDSYSEDFGAEFLPLELKTRLKDEEWQAAKRVGIQLLPYIERGTLTRDLPIDREQEAELRSEIGQALERSGDLDGAFERFGVASVLRAGSRMQLAAFVKRHPSYERPMEQCRARWQGVISSELHEREVQFEKDIHAKQVQVKAEPFHLHTLSGQNVTLDTFSGKPFLLVFWASWCAYCSQELDDLAKLLQAKDVADFNVLAVSVDTDAQAAKAFVKGKTLAFPVAMSDGKIDSLYEAEIIPQMVVIDAQGFIAFRIPGTNVDFGKSIRLMLKDVATPSQTPLMTHGGVVE